MSVGYVVVHLVSSRCLMHTGVARVSIFGSIAHPNHGGGVSKATCDVGAHVRPGGHHDASISVVWLGSSSTSRLLDRPHYGHEVPQTATLPGGEQGGCRFLVDWHRVQHHVQGS